MAGAISVSRIEKKYIIGEKERYILQNYFSKVLNSDPNNGKDGYLVRSLYFDTLYDEDYHEKIDGAENRHKLRLRIYDTDTKIVKLELKEKFGIYQQKQSLDVDKEVAKRMIKGDLSLLRNINIPLAQRVTNMIMMNIYRPKCIVEYQRFAYIYPANNIRITFDSYLKGTVSGNGFFSADLVAIPIHVPQRCIMEVKYDNFMLSYIKDVISACGVAQTAASKYCMVRELTL